MRACAGRPSATGQWAPVMRSSAVRCLEHFTQMA